MDTKTPRAASTADSLDDTQFYMYEGITRVENERLQAKANSILRQLFLRRVKRPAQLQDDFRSALRREGFIRIKMLPVSNDGGMSFEAALGKKLKAQLRSCKHLRSEDVLHGCVTGAARVCAIDPRVEDIGIEFDGHRIFGNASAVPFIHQTRALDKAMGWREPKRDRAKRKARLG